MDETFDERPRSIEEYVVESVYGSGERLSVSTTSSTGFGIEREYAQALPAGTRFDLETVNFSRITGIRVAGEWLFRKSDQQLRREHEAMVEGFRRRERERLDAHRAEWRAREDALPSWARERLLSFHKSGGERFELQGWGYELVVMELAVAYVESRGEDDERVLEISRREGTSGNQHDVARMLARAHLDDVDLAHTPSALTPLTGDRDYSGAGA